MNFLFEHFTKIAKRHISSSDEISIIVNGVFENQSLIIIWGTFRATL